MPTKPVEYLKAVRGFGTWRIAYDPEAKRWKLDCNQRAHGERWHPVREFAVAEAAAIVVAKRKTGLSEWDALGFGQGIDFDLSQWKTEASEGVQSDAGE